MSAVRRDPLVGEALNCADVIAEATDDEVFDPSADQRNLDIDGGAESQSRPGRQGCQQHLTVRSDRRAWHDDFDCAASLLVVEE